MSALAPPAQHRTASAAGTRPAVAYLGWSGRGNLGDDAIQEALQGATASTFEAIPLYPAEVARYLVSRPRHLRSAVLVLGGGTVIGRSNWRMHLRVAMAMVRTRPAWMLGAGVEDPAFQGLHSFSGRRELGRWKALLREFEAVTVRGPRSAELLADVGIDARVVGDPALLLRTPTDAPSATPGLIGVSLGFGDDLWGHDEEALVMSVAGAVQELRASGHRVRFLVANQADVPASMKCALLAGLGDAPDLRVTTHPADFMRQVSACDAFLGQRLHAVVLATAAGVPAVMLEYQPKCLDFMRSVGREAWSVRTDIADRSSLAAMLSSLSADRVAHANAIDDAVARLRLELEGTVARLRDALEIGLPGAEAAP
jgi:polysaccharide pyruvyl transferase WcaK-like protein